jgi:hypothetical protein
LDGDGVPFENAEDIYMKSMTYMDIITYRAGLALSKIVYMIYEYRFSLLVKYIYRQFGDYVVQVLEY